jgi:hypothetical protein
MEESTKRKKHIHQLKRHNYKNGERIYFCVNNCAFKVNVKLALGREVLCNVCGKPFIMNEYSIRLARPRCMTCINKKFDLTNQTVLNQEKSKEVSFSDLGIELPSSIINEEIKAPKTSNPVDALRERMRHGLKSKPTKVQVIRGDETSSEDLL